MADSASAARAVVPLGPTLPAVLAFEFLVLTAARWGEVRDAVWAKIDPAGRVWTVPAARMKMKREHRVPLCGRALEVLDAARTLRAGSGRAGFTARSGQPVHDDVIVGLPSRALASGPAGCPASSDNCRSGAHADPVSRPNRALWPASGCERLDDGEQVRTVSWQTMPSPRSRAGLGRSISVLGRTTW